MVISTSALSAQGGPAMVNGIRSAGPVSGASGFGSGIAAGLARVIGSWAEASGGRPYRPESVRIHHRDDDRPDPAELATTRPVPVS